MSPIDRGGREVSTGLGAAVAALGSMAGMGRPRAEDYAVLTFDCYGTLVDWASGIVDHLAGVLAGHGVTASDRFLLDFFAETEPEVQAEGGRYAEVLAEVLRRLAGRLEFTPAEGEPEAFAAGVGDWLPFPDTVASLVRLAEHFELVIVSNVDNDLFARTERQLSVRFSHVITAEDVGVYKPDRAMFDAALAAVGPGRPVLHVAQSLFHDIAPAAALGLDTAWIRRGQTAARAVPAQPTWGYATLAEFTDDILESAP